MSSPTSLELYTYFRSSCAARLRIALHLKDVAYTPKFVNLLKGEQLSEEHKALNPTASVPVLVAHLPSATPSSPTHFVIGQSLAALEYLEECESLPRTSGSNTAPSCALLPPVSSPGLRAHVRIICNIIACDIQPVTNLRIQKRVKALSGDADAATQWARELAAAGFEALERTIAKSAGIYCVGDEITLADVCIVPAVWAAQRVGVEIKEYPVVNGVFERMEQQEAVQRAHWRNQPDTPEELRG